MKRFALSIVFVFLISIAFSQERNVDSAMAYAEITDGYIYIPKTAMDNRFDAILIVTNKFNADHTQVKRFKFWWSAVCNDGYYNLTITPRQIYFHSSHDNPNPNYLYWVINIDSVQYQQISTGLQSQRLQGFSHNESNYIFHDNKFKDTITIPNDWTDEKEKEFEAACEKQIEAQLKRYSSILNGFIKEPDEKIKFPTKEEMEQIKPKLFSENKEELLDWRPHKFVPPVLKNK